jgi:hypothetical protein
MGDIIVNDKGGHHGGRRRQRLMDLEDCIALWGRAKGMTTTTKKTATTTTLMPPPAKYDVDTLFAVSNDGVEDGEGDDNIDGNNNILVKVNNIPSLLSLSSSSSSSSSSSPSSSSFRFCLIKVAILLSQSALRRLLRLLPSLSDRCLGCVGVGCRLSLVAGLPGGGGRGRRSCAYMACSMPGEDMWVWEVELDDGGGSGNSNGGDEDGVVWRGRGARGQGDCIQRRSASCQT